MALFRVLAIDGGGVRGIFPAHFLALAEKNTEIHLSELFDLIVGTSTGSIIAAAAAMNVPMERVVALYEQHADAIFPARNRRLRRGYFISKYDSRPLREVLVALFDDRTMADAKTKLVIPTTDVSNGNVFVIKSPYRPDFVRDGKFKVAEAVLASCAAPSYFDPVKMGEYLLADGGLWANNPSFVAYVEALGKLSVKHEDIRVLSIGTGTGHHRYTPTDGRLGWGLFTGWKGARLVDAAMNIQGRSSSNAAALLLGDKFMRVSFDETGSLPLDDPAVIPTLQSRAGEAFTYRWSAVTSFLQL